MTFYSPETNSGPVSAKLIKTAKALGAQNLVPATSGNFSARLDADTVLITRSGVDKGALRRGDLVSIPIDGTSQAKTSAETPLHLALYRHDPRIGAVLHTHSMAATVLSRLTVAEGTMVVEGFELQKAIAGVTTHAGRLEIDVHPNDQDIPALTRRIEQAGSFSSPAHAFLLEGHGLYAWGTTVDETYRHIVALEFLMTCLLEERRLGR